MFNGLNDRDIHNVVLLLKRGGIVALPTETVYGLAADATNPEAVAKIFVAKGRPTTHPLIVHIESFEQVADWAIDVPPLAAVLAQKFWPGPLTLMFKKAHGVFDEVTGGKPTICLRVPNHPVFLRVLKELKKGLAAPSANPYQRLSPTSARHVMLGLGSKIDAVVDGGRCARGIESTIVDLTDVGDGFNVRILRKGPITKAMLEVALPGLVVEEPDEHDADVSGNMFRHYQPCTHASLMSLESMEKYVQDPTKKDKRFAVVHYSTTDWNNESVVFLPQLPETKEGYEYEMFATLQEADQLGVDEILIERPPEGPDWVASLDRLRKATAKTSSRCKEPAS